MSDPRIRQIKIKTGVVKRLTKEKTVYVKEIDQQKVRIERLRGEGKDEHVLRKEEEILQEAQMMVPDSHRRLVKAYEELNDYLKNEDELKELPDFGAALEVLKQAKEKIDID
ncbi:tubulin-specific chaperone A [Sitodiplosis mosellana]|uniref:tubulin-specific chaperone A n=1 Tax=Sitodiplosis mosellana TaxID=263140 RepID=UPI002443BCD3|nr:tubulin-specific chaperone A [Sitodiplosis mosellana]